MAHTVIGRAPGIARTPLWPRTRYNAMPYRFFLQVKLAKILLLIASYKFFTFCRYTITFFRLDFFAVQSKRQILQRAKYL